MAAVVSAETCQLLRHSAHLLGICCVSALSQTPCNQKAACSRLIDLLLRQATLHSGALDYPMKTFQHHPGPDAASAGRPGASQKPALLQLNQDALIRVLADLEPEAPGASRLAAVCSSVLRRLCLRPEMK